MPSSAPKLSRAEKAGLAALGRMARSARSSQTVVGLHLPEQRTSIHGDEAVVLVLSKTHAVMGRTEIKGRELDMDALRAVLLGAEVAAERLRVEWPAPATPALSSAESSMLDEAGFAESEPGPDVLLRTGVELELLLSESFTLEEAAKALQVSTGRLRQRLSAEARTLYGIKVGRAWRLPRFQFATKRRLVRQIEVVLPAINAQAHPLAVARWFASPHQDLVTGTNDEAVTPVAWLEAGLDPHVVAELAQEI